jgi:hypothetical protein
MWGRGWIEMLGGREWWKIGGSGTGKNVGGWIEMWGVDRNVGRGLDRNVGRGLDRNVGRGMDRNVVRGWIEI